MSFIKITTALSAFLFSVTSFAGFKDDKNFDHMLTAIDRQLVRFAEKDLTKAIKLVGRNYIVKDQRDSLVAFRALVVTTRQCLKIRSKRATCWENFDAALKQKFDILKPGPAEPVRQFSRFTAYYTPLLEATRARSNQFPHGIYRKPVEENLRTLSRTEIDFDHKLMTTPYPMFYTKDLLDLYLLHVQGGGKVVIKGANGKTESHYISYDGTNSQPFAFISTYMVQRGYLSADNRSVEAQRAFLSANPDKQEEIYASCPNFVYFKITDAPPLGSDKVSLTDYRSIATDKNIYNSKGTLAFVNVKQEWQSGGKQHKIQISRFFLDQDTGGAIKGDARADIYMGEGPEAEFTAYNLHQMGEMYFLMLKKKNTQL